MRHGASRLSVLFHQPRPVQAGRAAAADAGLGVQDGTDAAADTSPPLAAAPTPALTATANSTARRSPTGGDGHGGGDGVRAAERFAHGVAGLHGDGGAGAGEDDVPGGAARPLAAAPTLSASRLALTSYLIIFAVAVFLAASPGW